MTVKISLSRGWIVPASDFPAAETILHAVPVIQIQQGAESALHIALCWRRLPGQFLRALFLP